MGSWTLAPWMAVVLLALGDDGRDKQDERAPEFPAVGSAGAPAQALTPRERERWLAGRDFFERELDERDGLGPAFNARSCATCHRDPVVGGAGGVEFNVALAPEPQGDEPRDEDPISRYLRTREEGGRQGVDVERLQRLAKSSQKQRERLVANTIQTPSILGLGALERVHEDEILGREDPHDRDGDGVRGIAKRVIVGGTEYVGRFGWGADLPTLHDFTRAACGGELGLTVPDEVGFGNAMDADDALDPEMTWEQLDNLVFYCRQLAPPARGGRGAEPEVVQGAALFEQIGCATCHVPTLYGADGAIHPYTDLLLHAVTTKQPAAIKTNSDLALFRTPPLWGISQTAPYLHDGRAPTLDEAILAHGGEAHGASQRYLKLTPAERAALLAFLEDL